MMEATTTTTTANAATSTRTNSPTTSSSKDETKNNQKIGKKDKKRFKKLKKRISTIQTDGERSGLLTEEEWYDYQRLIGSYDGNDGDGNDFQKKEKKNNFGPVINLRRNNNKKQQKQQQQQEEEEEGGGGNIIHPQLQVEVEGVHHRDLLAWLLKQIIFHRRKPNQQQDKGGRGKKRSRIEEENDDDDVEGNNNNHHPEQNDSILNSSIPTWASVHNPGMLQTIAILEIHVQQQQQQQQGNNKASYCDVDDISNALENQLKKNSKLISYIKVPTKWFQGHVPRSISESLLYYVAKKKKKKNKKDKKIQKISSNKEILIEKLKELILPLKDWNKEGYPLLMINNNNNKRLQQQHSQQLLQCSSSVVDDDDDDNNDTVVDPNNILLEDAKAMVERLGTKLESNSCKDDNKNKNDEKQEQHSQQLYISTIGEGKEYDDDDDKDLSPQSPRVFGMDCEMVLTTVGSELARITIVEFVEYSFSSSCKNNTIKTKTVMDCLVKPENPILDYLTKYSGITAKLLNPVTTRLPQIQVAMHKMLRPCDIIVGHSLENDLRATRYIHPNVIDTAIVFRSTQGRTKFSLRHLTGMLLGKKIQNGSHCSEEDAIATLELAINRAWIGESYFVVHGDERRSLFQDINKQSRIICTGPVSWLQSHVTSFENGGSIHALGYDDITQVKKAMLSWLKGGSRKAQLISSHVNLVSNNKGEETLRSLENLVVRTCCHT